MAITTSNNTNQAELDFGALGGDIQPINIESEMRKSYLDYAMSVIIGRALPDVRDGLKPVQRRILYAMREEGLRSNRPPRKCARIVGQVMGKYHPHGDTSIYDTLVRMAQPFSMRQLLVDGQGNFGSVDGDPPAAMRYTEARLAPYAEALLEDIDMDTVDFRPNYDDSAQEPEYLAAAAPNLLANGSDGIAVGMATHIPPHNLTELIDAAIQLVKHPNTRFERIVSIVQGPDFPTGGILCGRNGILEAYRTGRGRIVVRARHSFERIRKGRFGIVVTEIPFQVNKARLIKKAADLVNQKKLTGISDIRDESDRRGMRIVFELKRGERPEVVLNNLFKQTDLQHGSGVAILAIVDGRPEVLGLLDYLRHFIEHRRDVVRRRTNFLLRKARDREHVLLGFHQALERIDEVIALIRASKNPKHAKSGLMGEVVIEYSEFLRPNATTYDVPFAFTERQAQAIIELQLQRLTSMERQKILDELEELQGKIKGYLAILDSEAELSKVVISELRTVKKKFGTERLTEIGPEASYFSLEDLITEEDMVVTVSKNGYIKRTPLVTYRKQSRGGKGRIGMVTGDGDYIESLFVASTHSYMLIVTNLGKLHWLKVYNVPEVKARGRGRNIVNLLNFQPQEAMQAFLPVRSLEADLFVMMATRMGMVRKCHLSQFKRPFSPGVKVGPLAEGDAFVSVRLCEPHQKVFVATRLGQAVLFENAEVRATSRQAAGVKGTRLARKDEVIGMLCADDDHLVLTVSEYGFGRRTQLGKYRLTARGMKGVQNAKITRARGKVVAIMKVLPDDEVVLITQAGKIVRFGTDQVRNTGRYAAGVRVVQLDKGDRVAAAVVVPREDDLAGARAAPIQPPTQTLPVQ